MSLRDLGPAALVPVPLTIFTSMFLHGGFMHLVGNMWFLWIFGDNVEDRLGRVRFLAYYLVTGAIGAVAQCLMMPTSTSPDDRCLGRRGRGAGRLHPELPPFAHRDPGASLAGRRAGLGVPGPVVRGPVLHWAAGRASRGWPTWADSSLAWVWCGSSRPGADRWWSRASTSRRGGAAEHRLSRRQGLRRGGHSCRAGRQKETTLDR